MVPVEMEVMYSLNVPVPGAVAERAWSIRSQLLAYEQLRDEFTLVLKRLPFESGIAVDSAIPDIRSQLESVDPFTVEITGIGQFETPPAGPAPVIYFAISSPAMHRIHTRFVEYYGAVEEIEGTAYQPHITLARGGDVTMPDIDFEPISWTVDRLIVWDSRRALPAAEFALPV